MAHDLPDQTEVADLFRRFHLGSSRENLFICKANVLYEILSVKSGVCLTVSVENLRINR